MVGEASLERSVGEDERGGDAVFNSHSDVAEEESYVLDKRKRQLFGWGENTKS